MDAKERLPGLDLLRLLAVVMVLLAHLVMIPKSPAWIQPYMCYGSLGVSLFFVLSGFLVSGLLFNEYRNRRSMSIRRFYVRRAWKIYPPLYLMLAVTYFYNRAVIGWRIPDRVIFSELLFVQNYFRWYWSHTWSLAVEEHFYIGLPLLLGVLARRARGKGDPFAAIPRLVFFSLIFFPAVRLLNYAYRAEYSFQTHIFATHLRLDALFFGVGIAYWRQFRSLQFDRLRPWRHGFIAGGVALLALERRMALPSDLSTVFYHTLGLTLEFLASGAVMIGVLHCRFPKNAVVIWLSRLGRYSYPIYLWHLAMIYWVVPYLHTDWHVKAAFYLIAAFFIGIPISRLTETPMLNLRDRLYPSLASQPSVVLHYKIDREQLRRYRIARHGLPLKRGSTSPRGTEFELGEPISFRRPEESEA
jgi:peptidoglycan/LPS O-acetylase OafA/YrhL